MVTGASIAMSRSLQSFLLRLAPFYSCDHAPKQRGPITREWAESLEGATVRQEARGALKNLSEEAVVFSGGYTLGDSI